jgi:hypothetical protein
MRSFWVRGSSRRESTLMIDIFSFVSVVAR